MVEKVMVKSEGKRGCTGGGCCGSERKDTLFAKVLCACARRRRGHLAGKVVQETKDGGGAELSQLVVVITEDGSKTS